MPTTGSAPPTAPCFIAILVDYGLVVPLWDPPVCHLRPPAKKPPNSSTFRVIRSCNIRSNVEDKETLMLMYLLNLNAILVM
ncbi:hypothetical protein EJB05_50219 [Eragrostis curvula]|uniref:Uncharacterized protein n=1 Tax=Eragrostis curvula TaxID=38414 RepID=A0A5J9SYT8_9POAL|nr:hypothetical protein EJB05_50219 [Eragrostis curvula]